MDNQSNKLGKGGGSRKKIVIKKKILSKGVGEGGKHNI